MSTRHQMTAQKRHDIFGGLEPIGVDEACALLYGKGGRPHVETVRRWCRFGAKLRDGSRLRLKSVSLCGKRFTTARWCEEFEAQRLLAGLA